MKFWAEVRSAIATMMKSKIPMYLRLFVYCTERTSHWKNTENSQHRSVSDQKENNLYLENKAVPDLIDRVSELTAVNMVETQFY